MFSPAASSPGASHWPLRFAIAISVVAGGLRLWQARESLWLDELHTAWCAAGALDEIAPRAAIGNQSPPFFWLQWLLVRVVGPSELALRLPSLVAGSLLPLAMYLFARRWTSTAVGLLAAALVAIDPTAIFYATEARPYGLVQLLAAVHLAALTELILRPTAWLRAVWIALAALLFHLHFTSALLLPAELVFYGVVTVARPGDVHYRWTSLVTDVSIMAALWLPALPLVHEIFRRRANWASFVERGPLWDMFGWWPCALFGGYVAAGIAIDRALGGKRRQGSEAADYRLYFHAALFCWLLVPTFVAWLATQSDVVHLFFSRYLVTCSLGALLLAACCVGLVDGPLSRPIVGLSIFAFALGASGIIAQVRHDGRLIGDRAEDWRGAVAWLNEQLSTTQYPVLVASGFIEADALREPHDPLLEDYCLLPVTSLYSLDADRGDLIPLPMHEPGRLEQNNEMMVVHRGGAWLIVRGDSELAERVAARIANRLNRGAAPEARARWRIKESRSFGHVQVRLLAIEATD